MRLRLLLATAVTSGVFAAACSSGGGGGPTLASGTYIASASVVSPDTCFGLTGAQVNGHTVTLSVGTSIIITKFGSVQFSGILLVPTGNNLVASPTLGFPAGENFTTLWPYTGLSTTYNCVAAWSLPMSGSLQATNVFTLTRDFTSSILSGTQCVAAESSEFTTTLDQPGIGLLTQSPCEENITETLTKQ